MRGTNEPPKGNPSPLGRGGGQTYQSGIAGGCMRSYLSSN